MKEFMELIRARRLATRYGHFMSPQLLESQFATPEEPQASEHPIVVSIDAPPRAIRALGRVRDTSC
jgi:gluconate kinase